MAFFQEGNVYFYYTIDGHRCVFDLSVMKFKKEKIYIRCQLNVVDAITVRCVDWETNYVDMGKLKSELGD